MNQFYYRNIVLLTLLFTFTVSFTQPKYIPSEGNLKYREEFQDNKFGVFIHWGIYSMLGDGEWIMSLKRIHYDEYSKLARGFYPSNFNAAQWVSVIKSFGAKYICITTRHHDGFSMFDSNHTPYNIIQTTPFRRDILKELANECHKQGLKLHLYYSLIDWGRADYSPKAELYPKPENGDSVKWDTYHLFMKNQLTELLTNYGEIGAIWFDGKWDKPKEFDWKFDDLYSHIHKLQPNCLIINNHHLEPIDGEDAQTFEKDLPGQNLSGFSKGTVVGRLPLETCETMNNSWGYRITDNKYKSEKELIHYLVRAAGNNTNLLMNVGPRPDGTFPDSASQRFNAMGNWLKQFGETIYNTRGGIVAPRKWGVTTQKGNRHFIHILDLQDNVLFLPIVDKKVKFASVFINKKKVRYSQNKDGVILYLDKVPNELDYVVELVTN